MAAPDNNDEPGVIKDVDRVEIDPAPEGDDTIDPENTDPESPEGETGDEPEGGEPEGENRPDGLQQRQAASPEAAAPAAEPQGDDGLVPVEDETPRERALRLELHKTRQKLRGERTSDLLGTPTAPAAGKKEINPEHAAVLSKYKPEELSAIREILPALAEEMGFVREDQLAGRTYGEQAQTALDTFLDKHPEYTPEKDTDGTLWEAFKTEYGLYKQPANPKDFAKIFERIHRDVLGIQPRGPLPKVAAQRERAQVASHAGASAAPAPAPRASRPGAAAPGGLRLDMLKGFTDDEKAELTAGDE